MKKVDSGNGYDDNDEDVPHPEQQKQQSRKQNAWLAAGDIQYQFSIA